MNPNALDPPATANLTETQRAIWREFAEPLIRAGRVERIDVLLFHQFVNSTDEARHYSRLADEAKDEMHAAAARTVAEDAARHAAELWQREFRPLLDS